MAMEQTEERVKRRKRSLILDVEILAWLDARAEAASTSASAIARQVLRAAMQAEQQQQSTETAA